jgi:TonB family protein
MLLSVASFQQKAGVVLKEGGECWMRLSSSALAAVFILMPGAAGYAPALCQDFSITNQVEPANRGRRDVMRQLQALWDARAYYPKHASNSDEGGTVKVHLVILPDGRIWTTDVVESSGSRSLDTAGGSVFRGASVRPFLAGEPNADVDLSLHYVLAHRHDQPVAAGYAPVASKSPFTIANDPVKSPILETMLQRICTGTMVLGGVPGHSWYGSSFAAQAIFFRKPDGTPWVKLYERGYPSLSPVIEVGKMVTWTGRKEQIGGGQGFEKWLQYTAWYDGDNHLRGAIGTILSKSGTAFVTTGGGSTVDLTCATEVLPTVTWNDLIAQSMTSPTPIDPP